jgi:hypothetical protein
MNKTFDSEAVLISENVGIGNGSQKMLVTINNEKTSKYKSQLGAILSQDQEYNTGMQRL